MKFKVFGFRPFYHKFTLVPLTDKIKELFGASLFPEDANYILSFGYYDSTQGMMLVPLAAGHYEPGPGIKLTDLPESPIKSFPIRMIAKEEVLPFEEDSGKYDELFRRHFGYKLKFLKAFSVSDEVEVTRNQRFLDGFRDKNFIDHVLITLFKKGLNAEQCWVEIKDLRDYILIGELLQEPAQNFGYHKGDTIPFSVVEMEKGDTVGSVIDSISDIEKEDLSDGSILEASIHTYKESCTQENRNELFRIIRNSYLWICDTPEISEEELERIKQKARDLGRDEVAFTRRDLADKELFMRPHQIMYYGTRSIPVFTSLKEIQQGFVDSSNLGANTVQLNFKKLIEFARKSDVRANLIVINPFSDSLVLNKEDWGEIESIKSRWHWPIT